MKYELIEIKPQYKIFEVFIKADQNDGDYISTLTSYTEEEFNTKIVDDLILLQSKYSGSHELGLFNDGICDKYERDTVLNIPYPDLDCIESCHTLKELKITCTDTNGKIYSVKINDLV